MTRTLTHALSRPIPPLLALCLGLNLGCGDAGGDAYDASPTPAYGGDYPYPEPTPTPAEGGDDLPEEQADSFYRAAPAATEAFVYVVNPDRDTVSKINATTQAVYTLPTGRHPTQVLIGRGGTQKAVVLNEVDATLGIYDTASDEVKTVGIHPDTNFMALRGDGLFAVTHYSAQVEGAADDINGVRSYSAISVVFTGEGGEAPTSTPITVGLNPRQVTWIAGEDRALVLCDDAVALVELSATPTARLIPLTEDPDESLTVSEIKVSPDGRYAYFRTGQARLLVVDLDQPTSPSAVFSLGLPGVPSDMELADDKLILVDRANRELVIFDPLDPEAEPEIVPTPANQLVGAVRVVPELGKGILYTTLTAADVAGTSAAAIPLNRFSVWDLETGAIRVKELVKPVEAVLVHESEDAPVAVFLHDGSAPSDIDAFDGEEAFSQYYFDDGLVVPAVLEAPTRAVAETPDGRYGFLILEETLSVVVVDFETRQMAGVPIQSEPVFVGILTGSSLGYVSQQHALGRLSFVDPDALTVSTITGFELNSQL